MRKIVDYNHDLGGDGGQIEAAVDIDQGFIEGVVKIKYPIAKAAEPVLKLVDPLFDKLKNLIPGNWDDPAIDAARKAFDEGVIKLLSGV